MSVADKYQALDDTEHAIMRPGMYIGGHLSAEQEMFLADIEIDDAAIIKKPIMYNAGMLRIFEEILLNAFDHTVRDSACTEIKVSVDRDSGFISVMNNGAGIPVVKKEELGIYIPEMLFGKLRSGSNFDDSKKRITGGMHGMGASLAVIYSEVFMIQTVDANTKKMYTQQWEIKIPPKNKNGVRHGKPEIIKYEPEIKNCRKKPYTFIMFKPNLDFFEVDELSDDFVMLVKKRLIDIGFVSGPKVRTYFNDEEITIKKPEQYMMLYKHPVGEKPIIDVCDRWTVGVVLSNNGFQHASFVNGVHTTIGGTHVEHVAGLITKEVIAKVAKKIAIKPSDVKNKMFLFINAVIENPEFSSQTKESLKTPRKDYGSEYVMSETFRKKLLKSSIVSAMTAVSDTKQMKDLEKINGAKTVRLGDIPDLEDANWAARNRSMETKLILCEGKSAKTFAMSALKVIGRDRFGIFPLRGKLLNVRGVDPTKITANAEIKNIIRIIGLKIGTTYEDDKDFNQLRYGGIISLTDSDVDGIHISGLIINFIHAFWPALIERGFINYCITPIVKVFQGSNTIPFYTLNSFEEWMKTASGKYKSKYFKGLGTSTRDDACDALSNIDNKLIAFQRDDECDEHMSLAFNSKRADDRKEWLLYRYDPASCIDRSKRECDVSSFIDHELIHFSTYDCERSIPNVMDGLKTSQRKILYIAMKHIVKNEMKVAQFGAKVSEQTDYHHGEVSLMGAVINMAQDYVSSNNINLLMPNGGFGTRLAGGKDAASPRYIFTQVNPIALRLFDQRDNCLLTHNESDDAKIEPKCYYPVLPTVLINGALGIATGFSTSVLKYNPRDLGAYIKSLLMGKTPKPILPWYKGFNGFIEANGPRKYTTYGIWEFIDDKRMLRITELPINVWTDDYKAFSEAMLSAKNTILSDIIYDHDDINIDIKFVFKKAEYDKVKKMDRDDLVKMFKLSSKLSETNMYLFTEDGKLKYFEKVKDIIEYYYEHRLEMYALRRDAMIEQLRYEMLILTNKAKFIGAVKQGKINMRTMTEESLLKELKKGFDEDPRASGSEFSKYNYLVDMNYRSFTNENAQKMKDLVEQKQQEIDELESTTTQQMWTEDIDELLAELDKQEKSAVKKPTKKVVKSRKK